MNKDKIYLPKEDFTKDDYEQISFSLSKEGLIIPLDYYGYANIHLTIYIKKMESDNTKFKLSIHLTDNIKKTIIEEEYLEFNNQDIVDNFENRPKDFILSIYKIIKKYFLPIDKLNFDRLICYDCFAKSHFENYPLNTKEKSKNSLKEMDRKLRMLVSNGNSSKCSNPIHKTFLDLDNGEIIQLTKMGYFAFSNKDLFMKEIDQLTEKEFSKEIEWIEKTKQKFKLTLSQIEKFNSFDSTHK